jgi:hypothetical protein
MLARMLTRHARFRLQWATFLTIALAVAGMGGLHLHLCFDGGEPATSLHVRDAGIHHGLPASGDDHADVDLALDNDVLSKFGKFDFEFAVPTTMALLLWTLLLGPASFESSLRRFAPVRWHHVRPPLRGPPPRILPVTF